MVASLVVATLELWRFEQPRASLFSTPEATSLADAITRDDVLRAYEFIRAGQDPNAAISAEHPAITAGRRVSVSPLLWAVAAQSDRSAAMLFSVGARPSAAEARQAACLANWLKRDDLARQIVRQSGLRLSAPCPTQWTGDSALLGAIAVRE
jgi:hypothetical protein